VGLKLDHPYPTLELGRREPYIFNLVRGKNVVDLGFVDVGHERLEKGGLLHLEIARLANVTFGVDIDDTYRHLFPPQSETYQLYFGDVEDPETFRPVRESGVAVDLVLAGEIMEHLNNPGLFLDAIRTVMGPGSKLIVTVPNGLRAINHGYTQKGMEWVHPDHNYWYSPTTIQNLLNKNGFHVDYLRGYTYGNETSQMLGPCGLGCPGLIAEASAAQPGEALRRWPDNAESELVAAVDEKTGRIYAQYQPKAQESLRQRKPADEVEAPTPAPQVRIDPAVAQQALASAASATEEAAAPASTSAARSHETSPFDPSHDRPRVLAITDQPGWAFEHIFNAVRDALADRYDLVSLPYTQLNELGVDGLRARVEPADAVYCFSAVMPDAVYDVLSMRPMTAGIHNDHQFDYYAEKLTAARLGRFVAIGCANANLRRRTLEMGLHDRVVVTSSGVDVERFSPPATPRTGPVRAGWAGQIGHSGGKLKQFYERVVPGCAAAGLPLLPAVREKNPVPFEQMPDYYRLIDLLIVASIGEGSSGPLLEAAASGCLPVSTRVGVAEQQITHGENGLLLADDLDAITETLYWCRQHPERVRAMGEAARQNVLEHWTWAKRAEHFAELFDLSLAEQPTAV